MKKPNTCIARISIVKLDKSNCCVNVSLYSDRTSRYIAGVNSDRADSDSTYYDDWVIVDDLNDGSESESVICLCSHKEMLGQ